jgi:hypothetical protein
MRRADSMWIGAYLASGHAATKRATSSRSAPCSRAPAAPARSSKSTRATCRRAIATLRRGRDTTASSPTTWRSTSPTRATTWTNLSLQPAALSGRRAGGGTRRPASRPRRDVQLACARHLHLRARCLAATALVLALAGRSSWASPRGCCSACSGTSPSRSPTPWSPRASTCSITEASGGCCGPASSSASPG